MKGGTSFCPTNDVPVADFIPMSTDRPSGLEFDDFLPVSKFFFKWAI